MLAMPRPGDFSEGETFLSTEVNGELPSFIARAPSTLQVPPQDNLCLESSCIVSIWKNVPESLILLCKKEILLFLARSVSIALRKNRHQCLD